MASEGKSPLPWTEAEKLQLLFNLLPKRIDWSKVELPPGRTKIACVHIIQKMRDAAREASGDGPAAAPKKATGKRTRRDSDEDDDNDDPSESAPAKPPAKKPRAAPKHKVPVEIKKITPTATDNTEEDSAGNSPGPKRKADVKVKTITPTATDDTEEDSARESSANVEEELSS